MIDDHMCSKKKQSPTDSDGKYFCNGKYKSHGRWVIYYAPPPLYSRGGDMLVYFCPLSTFCPSVSFLSVCPALSCRRANTRYWPNAGLILAHCPRRWANISPVLGYRVVFGATLNVRHHHRQWANINPALVQGIMPVPTACRYCQHEVLTRAEWILASTSDAGPTFSRHWVGVGLLGVLTNHIVFRTSVWGQTE